MKITKETIDLMKKMALAFDDKTVMDSYDAGYSAGSDGANMANCHFSFFQTEEHMKAWNDGKEDAEAESLTAMTH